MIQDSDSNQVEEPEFEQCHIERQEPGKFSQPNISTNMTPLAESSLKHGQENIVSDIKHVDHIDIQQGSMAPPTAISSDQLIDPHLSLDPDFLVPIEESVGSVPTKTTQLSNKYDESLELPSTEDNNDSLIKTEEFLEFVDELSQEPSPRSEREGTLECDTVPSVKADENLHSIVVDETSESVDSSNKSTDLSVNKVPKGDDVESTDISITESQFSSTMPYCEEGLVARLDPLCQCQFCQHNLVIRKKQLCLMKVQILSLMRGFQLIAPKIVLLVLLLARFLQKLPVPSLILFLT